MFENGKKLTSYEDLVAYIVSETAERGYTQSDVARKIDAGTANVSYWYNGKRRINFDNAIKLLDALGKELVVKDAEIAV